MNSLGFCAIFLYLSLQCTVEGGLFPKTEKAFFKIMLKEKFVQRSTKKSDFYNVPDAERGVQSEIKVSIPLELKYASKKESDYAPFIKLNRTNIMMDLKDAGVSENGVKKAYITTETKTGLFFVQFHCIVEAARQIVMPASPTSRGSTQFSLPITEEILHEALRLAKKIDAVTSVSEFYQVSESERNVPPRVRVSIEIEFEYANLGDPQYVPTVLKQLGKILKAFGNVPEHGLKMAYLTREISDKQCFLHFNCIVTPAQIDPVYVTIYLDSGSSCSDESERRTSEKSGSKSEEARKLLGVDKKAKTKEIEKAYRKLAMVHHPDRHATATPEEQAFHEAEFKKILAAYQYLVES